MYCIVKDKLKKVELLTLRLEKANTIILQQFDCLKLSQNPELTWLKKRYTLDPAIMLRCKEIKVTFPYSFLWI